MKKVLILFCLGCLVINLGCTSKEVSTNSTNSEVIDPNTVPFPLPLPVYPNIVPPVSSLPESNQ
jgi:hypothetical protein